MLKPLLAHVGFRLNSLKIALAKSVLMHRQKLAVVFLLFIFTAAAFGRPIQLPVNEVVVSTGGFGGINATTVTAQLSADRQRIKLLEFTCGDEKCEIPLAALNVIPRPNITSIRVETETTRNGERSFAIVMQSHERTDYPTTYRVAIVGGKYRRTSKLWDAKEGKLLRRHVEQLHVAGGMSRVGSASLDVYVSVLRDLLERRKAQGGKLPEFCFVYVDSKDPSKELLSRFEEDSIVVKPGSELKRKGLMLSVSKFRLRDEGTAELVGQSSLGTQGREIYQFVVEMRDGKWKVVQVKLLGQS